MIEKNKLKAMIKYIRQLESGILQVNNIEIQDEIKIRRCRTKSGDRCIKILIKLPEEE